MNMYFLSLYFFVYGFFGWCTEVAFAAVKDRKFVNRGFLNGPICPIYGFGVTIVAALLTPYKDNLLILYVFSVLLVTILEGLTGWAMDVLFHHKWWDYSDQPLNIGGYVCIVFSLIWGVACVLIMKFIHPLVHMVLTFIPHTLGIVIIIILGVTIFCDLYVTISAILKFNRHMEKMEKFAKDLHEISDQIGDDISEKVFNAIERQEVSRQKFDDAATELREFKMETTEEMHYRINELKERYNTLNKEIPSNCFRLINAFPKMQARRHGEQFEVFKKRHEEIRRQIREELKKTKQK